MLYSICLVIYLFEILVLDILQIFKIYLIICAMYWNVLWFHLFRDLGEVMDFELDVECSVDPDPEASSSKSSSSSLFPEVCLNTNMLKKKNTDCACSKLLKRLDLPILRLIFFTQGWFVAGLRNPPQDDEDRRSRDGLTALTDALIMRENC